jgi:hypothetical protein
MGINSLFFVSSAFAVNGYISYDTERTDIESFSHDGSFKQLIFYDANCNVTYTSPYYPSFMPAITWHNMGATGEKYIVKYAKIVEYSSYHNVYLASGQNGSGTITSYVNEGTAALCQNNNVTNLVASSIEFNSATLSFTTPLDSDFNKYKIYQDESLIYTSLDDISKDSQVNYSLTGLTQSTNYTYKITTIDINNVESKGVSIDVMTLSPTPTPVPTPVPTTPPINLVYTTSATDVQLSWTAPTDAVSYMIYRDGAIIGTAITPNYTDTAVTDGNKYIYDIRSIDGTGNISERTSAIVYFSKNGTDFSSVGNGFTASDIVGNAGAFLYIFIGLILLVASIKFAPQIQNFIFSLLHIVKDQNGKQLKDKNSKRHKLDVKQIKESIEPLKREALPKIDFSRTAIPKVEQRDFKKSKSEPRPTKVSKRNYDVIHREKVQRRKQATSIVIPKIKRKRGIQI